MDEHRQVKKHRGVIIYKELREIPGTSLRELKDGRMVPCAPKYEVYFKHAGGYPHDTIEEVVVAIDRVWSECNRIGVTDLSIFIRAMNDDTP